jgi:hypothetical protein
MERLFYCAGSSFVTGNDIAQVLLEYARWVIVRDTVDLVAVPTQGADGAVGRTAILLSSTTQLSAETMAWEGEEFTDPDFVDRLRRDIERMRHPQVPVAEEKDDRLLDSTFDY